jgi:hypothetical protein
MTEPTMITAEPAHPIASVVIGLMSFVLLCLLAVMVGTTPPADHTSPPAAVVFVTQAAQTIPIPIPPIRH